jgi:hypothetical protein
VETEGPTHDRWCEVETEGPTHDRWCEVETEGPTHDRWCEVETEDLTGRVKTKTKNTVNYVLSGGNIQVIVLY